MRIEVTAKAGCIYEGVPRPEGEVFSCEANDAKVLKLIDRVEFDDALLPAEPAKPKAKRQYKRKDMTAED